MSYIGKEPQYTDFLSKFFNGDGTAMTVTLDASPPNEAALLVFIDGVRQDTSAYTVSGYSLTFTGAVPSGTNNVQVVHLGIAQDTQVPVDDSVSTVKIQDDAVTSAKLDTNISIDGDLTVDTDTLYVDSSNNRVGIGQTTNPGYRLLVKQSGNTSLASIGVASVNSDNDTYIGMGYDATSDTCRIIATYDTGGAFKPISFFTSDTERMRIDSSGNLRFDSGYGSVATAYGCRAWVNFNGSGTVAIRASGNVSSITDNGTGDYTVNFTSAMPDADYCAVYGRVNASSGHPGGGFSGTPAFTENSVRLTPQRNTSGINVDVSFVTVAIFR